MSQGYGVADELPEKLELGYRGDVEKEYLVEIEIDSPALREHSNRPRSKSGRRPKIYIKALLQEKFEMSTESDWAPLTAASFLSYRVSQVAQLLTGYTLVSRWLTRQIWRGTTPLNFTLNLKFVAETDAQLEVLLPCVELQRICLPYQGDKELGDWLLSPPGPSPFQFWFTADEGKGEIINISIGKFLTINRAVVKRVGVSFPPQFIEGGLPTSANVSISFQTFEILTKEVIDSEVYKLRPIRVVTDAGPGGVAYEIKRRYDKAAELVKKEIEAIGR